MKPKQPKPKSKASRALVQALGRALSDKKAEDLRVLDVSAESSITDYLVLATGNSETHLRALRVELDRVLKESATHVVGRDDVRESGWTVVDAFDVMVHLFITEKRELFNLEQLWRDAKEVPLDKLLAEPKPRRRKKPAAG